MIKISHRNRKQCSGCTACYAVCAKKSISMVEDNEGFLYPTIDRKSCTKCGLCKKVCPFINPGAKRKPKTTLASKNKDAEVQLASSSGGIFTPLADMVLAKNGVVFGARFNENWKVVHDWIEKREDVERFRGSKYVQSYMGDNFLKVKEFLRAGREVLFSGTPCQTAGLLRYLGRKYENLSTVDFICHGAPSPLVFKKYVAEESSGKSISDIKFREKSIGWREYRMQLSYEDADPSYSNIFLQGFLADLFLRPSCHACKVKGLSSGSDITIADYWGIDALYPSFADRKGVSLVMPMTEKGVKMLDTIADKSENMETEFKPLLRCNSSLWDQSHLPRKRRKLFFRELDSHPVSELIEKHSQESFMESVHRRIVRRIKFLGK